jgi:hypothetical protein
MAAAGFLSAVTALRQGIGWSESKKIPLEFNRTSSEA